MNERACSVCGWPADGAEFIGTVHAECLRQEHAAEMSRRAGRWCRVCGVALPPGNPPARCDVHGGLVPCVACGGRGLLPAWLAERAPA